MRLFCALRFLSKAKAPKTTNIITVGSAIKKLKLHGFRQEISLSQPGVDIS
jgi:hypothetical protein